ncbi:hypothetical protein [Luteitalea sp. TBR-22]|uniref:hypothetical protein n=1 Tax=Luteitalea sp. TBR-22 TaxID=2802971 RepID=UPI001EF4868D|nr:hypothetical protein [Luteitalea sp. TBR-22]
MVVAAVIACPVAVSAQFIVPDQQYRCPEVEPQCPGSTRKLRSFEEGHGYTINFVEVKDDGTFWDERQLTEALDQIAKARNGGLLKPIVFVYIHGWQNNADELKNVDGETDCVRLRGDVAKFRTCGVARLAASAGGSGSRPVVGIYLAWRGLSSTVEPMKHLISYWPRRNKARTVGRQGMFTALDRIVKKVAEHRDDYVLVMVGHSFGARVLEYAAEAVDHDRRHCGFMERFRERMTGLPNPECLAAAAAPTPATTDPVLPPVDLFAYVNAATSHRMTYKALDDWARTCSSQPSTPGCAAAPMYLATSSRTDFATSFLMPVANLVGPAFKADRLHLLSAANTPWAHTHHDPKKVRTCPTLTADSFCFEGPEDDLQQNGPTALYHVRAHTNNSQRRFWIFNTGRRIVRNHGDVWNKRIFNMILALLEKRLAER